MKPALIELQRFTLTGVLAVATDFSVYLLLVSLLGFISAKTLSFLAGSIVAFFLNKYWTFENDPWAHRQLLRFAVLYISTLGANVGVNQLSLRLLPEFIIVAFLMATGTSTVLNFLGMKYWVFPNSKSNTPDFHSSENPAQGTPRD